MNNGEIWMSYDLIDENFVRVVKANQGAAVIFAGSESDEEHICKIIEVLERYRIAHDLRICSAHKQPLELHALLTKYQELPGALVIIAVAGATDALSGVVSFHSLHPVISCPPDAPNQSSLSNPSGSSNLYLSLLLDL